MAIRRPALIAFVACTACGLDEVPAPHEGAGASGDTAADTAPPVEDPEAIPDVVYPHLGVLLIDTAGQAVGDGAKIDAWLEVVRDHDGTLTDLDTAPRDFEGPIGIELHGSSSASYAKLTYRFEFRDSNGDDTDEELLDLPAGSDWVLHGPYCDKTFVRNALAYDLGRTLAADTGQWQPRTQFAELFLNDVYEGLYVVTERVARGKDRVDIPKPAASAKEGDLSGGYIVKVDQLRDDGWTTTLGTPIDWYYPRADAITAEQSAWLAAWVDDFEAALSGESWDDPATGWPARIDARSWVDHYIIDELAHNIDAYRLSTYLVIQPESAGGRIEAGPLWDFDRAWGDVDYCNCWSTEGFVIDDLTTCGYASQYPFWWSKLLTDPAFTRLLRCRWEELRRGDLSDPALLAHMQALVDGASEAEVRDHETWGTIGVDVDPNYYVGETFGDEVQYLGDWMVERAAWLDANLPGTCN